MADLIKREAMATPVVYEPRPQDIWVDDYLDQHAAKYYQVILKRKWLVLGVALVVFAGAVVYTYNTKPVYKSTVRIQIDPDLTVMPYKDIGVIDPNANPRYLETQIEVLRSEILVRRVVRRLNMATAPEQVATAASAFISRLEPAHVPSTQVVKVSYASEDPQFAATAANALAAEYIDFNLDSKREASAAARNFLERELLELKPKLEQSEERLVRYARDHNMGPTDGTNNVVLQKLSDLNQEMTRVEAQVLANQYDSVKGSTQSNFPESLKTPTMKDLEHRLSTLQERHSDMALEFGPKWPELVALDQQIADVKRQLESETKRSLQQVKMDHDLAEAHRQRVAAAVADQTGLADQLSQDSIQYNILKRDVETDRQLRDGLLQRLKETGVSEGFRFANIRVIDSAKVQSKPDSPNVPMNLALGLTMGLTCGLMLAFFGEFIDRTVKTPEDVVQTLGLPFLATIPVFQKSWKKATGGLLVQGERRTHENALVPSMNFGGHMYWESYRSLRTSLLLSSSDDRRPQTILVTSSLPGEGKSSTVVNLGITLAQTGARTLILELDLRKPSLGNLFHLPKANGMSRYLAGQTDLHTQILSAGIPNLFIIPAGPALPNPPELMGSKRMDLALNLLSGYFDYIVIDSPPVMAVTDALVIASQADGVVLVVQGGKTPKAVVQNTRNLLLGVGARILGALITRADPKHSDFGYYHREVYSNDTDSYSAVS